MKQLWVTRRNGLKKKLLGPGMLQLGNLEQNTFMGRHWEKFIFCD
jgi:hypothetical protein